MLVSLCTKEGFPRFMIFMIFMIFMPVHQTVRLTGLGPKSNVDANRWSSTSSLSTPFPDTLTSMPIYSLMLCMKLIKLIQIPPQVFSLLSLLSFAIVASIMLALVVFKMVSVRSYSPLGNPSAELLLGLTGSQSAMSKCTRRCCFEAHAAIV